MGLVFTYRTVTIVEELLFLRGFISNGLSFSADQTRSSVSLKVPVAVMLPFSPVVLGLVVVMRTPGARISPAVRELLHAPLQPSYHLLFLPVRVRLCQTF